MTLDERLSALQAMLDRARQTSAARGIRLPKDLPPRSQRTKSFSDQLADAEEELVREATSDSLPVDDDEDLIDLSPETSLEPASDSHEDENGAMEPPGSEDSTSAPIQLTAFAEEPAAESTMVSNVPRHVAVAAAAAARGELVRFGGGFPDEEGTAGDVDQIEAQALAEAVIAKAAAIRPYDSVAPPPSEDPEELIDLGADAPEEPADTGEPPEPEDDDDGLATLPPKARGRSSAPPVASGRPSVPIQLDGLDQDLGGPPPSRTPTGTDRPEPPRTPTGTDRPQAAPTPAGAEKPQITRTPTGTDRPQPMRTPTGTDRPEPAPPSLALRRPPHAAPPAYVAPPVIDPAPTFGAPPSPQLASPVVEAPALVVETPAPVAPPAYVAPPLPGMAVNRSVDDEDEIELDDADVYESIAPAETAPVAEASAAPDSRDEPGAFFAPEEVVDPAEKSPHASSDSPDKPNESSSAGDGAPEIHAPLTEDEPPASQRQPREPARPIDDALDGVEEPAPESGEVQSQRFASGAPRALDTYGARESAVDGDGAPYPSEPPDDQPTPPPPPVPDETAQVRSLGSVDVIDRSPAAPGIVPLMTSERKRAPATFGDLLDDALDLGASAPSDR